VLYFLLNQALPLSGGLFFRKALTAPKGLKKPKNCIFGRKTLHLPAFMMKRIYPILMALFLLTGCSKFTKIQKSNDYAYKLQEANNYFAAQSWDHARELYEECYGVFKGQKEFESLYFNLSYCYYNQTDYLSAENFFKGYVETFPNSTRAEEADFMRCFCYYKQSPKVDLDQTATTKAMANFQSFINTHPGSSRIKEASDIIDKCRLKLEEKAFRSADLYYGMGSYKAAAVAFGNLLNDFGDSPKADSYKLMMVKSYFMYADNSVEEKQIERFEQVLNECSDFSDRFPESKLLEEIEKYKKISQENIKNIKNEQNKKAA
jgi:outer membrane protein assembly factor BamD